MKKYLIIIIIVVILAIILGGGYYIYSRLIQQKPVACTMEAKICPDGSSVGRTGPKCEFADCPNVSLKQIFSSQEECEKTGCTCGYAMCDRIPLGKTFEEVCGKDFKEGWQCMGQNKE